MVLNQDFVAAMVKLEGMARRLEMAEREKDRMNASLTEAQVGADFHSVGCNVSIACRIGFDGYRGLFTRREQQLFCNLIPVYALLLMRDLFCWCAYVL
jgi:hypothetical protein